MFNGGVSSVGIAVAGRMKTLTQDKVDLLSHEWVSKKEDESYISKKEEALTQQYYEPDLNLQTQHLERGEELKNCLNRSRFNVRGGIQIKKETERLTELKR